MMPELQQYSPFQAQARVGSWQNLCIGGCQALRYLIGSAHLFVQHLTLCIPDPASQSPYYLYGS